MKRRIADRTTLPRPYAGDEQRAEQLRTLSDAVMRGRTLNGQGTIETDSLVVILDQELPAASHSKKGSYCWATICQWDARHSRYLEPTDYETEQDFDDDQDLTDDERDERNRDDPNKVIVFNHSEYSSHDKNTFGEAKWKDAHYWFFADCGPMADRRIAVDELDPDEE